jgi:hypothetical protein
MLWLFYTVVTLGSLFLTSIELFIHTNKVSQGRVHVLWWSMNTTGPGTPSGVLILYFLIPGSANLPGVDRWGFCWIFYVRYSNTSSSATLGFHCVGGCWSRTQTVATCGIDIQTAVKIVQQVLHCKDKMPKIGNKYSQKRNIGASVPISTFMCLWANYTYIPTTGLPFLLEEICGPILEIYKSLTDTWMWKLWLRPSNSQKRNI